MSYSSHYNCDGEPNFDDYLNFDDPSGHNPEEDQWNDTHQTANLVRQESPQDANDHSVNTASVENVQSSQRRTASQTTYPNGLPNNSYSLTHAYVGGRRSGRDYGVRNDLLNPEDIDPTLINGYDGRRTASYPRFQYDTFPGARSIQPPQGFVKSQPGPPSYPSPETPARFGFRPEDSHNDTNYYPSHHFLTPHLTLLHHAGVANFNQFQSHHGSAQGLAEMSTQAMFDTKDGTKAHADPDTANKTSGAPLDRFDLDTFQLEHSDIKAAREFIASPPHDDCEPLKLKNDDWQQVKTPEEFNKLCVELLHAIETAPGEPPSRVKAKGREAYKVSHQRTFDAVENALSTEHQIKIAQARVMLVMHEVVRIHEVGIPKIVLAKMENGKRKGFQPDVKLICSERADGIIKLARENKYVALDILAGKNIETLAQAPTRYGERKTANFETNHARGEKLKSVRGVGKGKGKKRARDDDDDDDILPSPAATPTATPDFEEASHLQSDMASSNLYQPQHIQSGYIPYPSPPHLYDAMSNVTPQSLARNCDRGSYVEEHELMDDGPPSKRPKLE